MSFDFGIDSLWTLSNRCWTEALANPLNGFHAYLSSDCKGHLSMYNVFSERLQLA